LAAGGRFARTLADGGRTESAPLITARAGARLAGRGGRTDDG
jgi:hypothetical protein